MNSGLLKRYMFRNGDTQKTLSKWLGITPTTLSSKMRGVYAWKTWEIEAISKHYKIELEDVWKIFIKGANV